MMMTRANKTVSWSSDWVIGRCGYDFLFLKGSIVELCKQRQSTANMFQLSKYFKAKVKISWYSECVSNKSPLNHFNVQLGTYP
jgi:hypothetical protein